MCRQHFIDRLHNPERGRHVDVAPRRSFAHDPASASYPSNMAPRLYMVVEHFKDTAAVYRRFQERGRLAPEGLTYISSWVDETLQRCFQLMETHDRALLDQWIANWSDLTDFEVYPVISSQQAAEKVNAQLPQPQ